MVHHDFVFLTKESWMDSRPYSAIDISTNLHNKVTKRKFFFFFFLWSGYWHRQNTAYAVKALRELHQKKEIECRVAGEIISHDFTSDKQKMTPPVN